MTYNCTYDIEMLGFKPKEIDAIAEHFYCSLNQHDWESIELLSEINLEGDEDIEDYENCLEIPTGRIAYFSDELIRKEQLAQID